MNTWHPEATISPDEWQTSPSPTRRSLETPPGAPWKTYLGEVDPHGREVVLVNGTHVRDHYDSDFSQGGNGFRYRFIPRGELWIDAQIHSSEWPFIAFHESHEAALMKTGVDYDHAHARAKRLENQARRNARPA